MRVALYFVITLFGSIGMGWWSLGWGCCVVRVELVCWRLIWFQCHYLVGWLVMLCSLVSFLWWLVCRGDVGWWSWCCDSRDCGGLRGDTCFVVISWGAFVWCVFCGQESVVILNDSWDLGDLHCCVDQSYEVIIVEWLWFLIFELVL